jgi:hypothetical protein
MTKSFTASKTEEEEEEEEEGIMKLRVESRWILL